MGSPPSASQRASTPAAPPRPWLFSPALDLLVGCGAWSLPLLALTFFAQRENAVAASFSFYLLAVFCNNPHYMATIYRAYGTAADFKKYRFFTVYVTVLLALTVVLVHLGPGLMPWVVTLYLTWSPWHYTGQNFGIAQMLVRRAGAPPDAGTRRLLWFSYVACYAVWFLTLHSARAATDPYFLSLGLPAGLATLLQLFFTVAFLGCAGAAFVRLARALGPRGLAGPVVLTMTQMLWFVLPALFTRFAGLALPASYFSAGALAFMHCAQYLWITSYYARRESPNFNFSRYYVALIVGGIALFVPGPWVASRLLGHDFVESFLIFMALVNVHHFILDGAIWKLRDGRIARLLLGRPTSTVTAGEMPAIDATGASHHLGWLFGPTPAARQVRWVLGGTMLGLGALDQWQFFSTTRTASGPALARAATVNPADPRPGFRRAQDLETAGDLVGARRALEALLAHHPHNATAQQLLGRVLMRLNDSAAALAHYDRMFELYPRDASVAFNRGLAALAEDQPPKALASFERAARLSPDNPDAHAALAEELARHGEPQRAIDEYQQAIDLVEADPGSRDLRDYLRQSLAQADLLETQATPAALERAERRLQRAGDVGATRHFFRETATLLAHLATVQEKRGHTEEAAKTRVLATKVEGYAH